MALGSVMMEPVTTSQTRATFAPQLVGALFLVYVVGGRGLANVSAGALFISEVLLAGLLAALLADLLHRRGMLFVEGSTLHSWLITLFIVATLRLVFFDLGEGFWALRDYVVFVYPLTALIVFHLLVTRPHYASAIGKALVVTIPVAFISYSVSRLLPGLHPLESVLIGERTVVPARDVIVGLQGAAMAVLLSGRAVDRQGRLVIGATLALSLLASSSASSLLALVIVGGLFLSAQENAGARLVHLAAVWMPIGLISAAIALVVLQIIGFSDAVAGLLDEFQTFTTIIRGEVTDQNSDTLAVATTNWRFAWWSDLLFGRTPTESLIGQGFGADIATEFQRDFLGVYDYSESFGWERVRGAHNITVTSFARMGIIGFALVATIVVVQVAHLAGPSMRAAISAGHLTPFEYAVWGYLIGGTINSQTQYTWDAPYAALPYWTLFGVFLVLRSQLPGRAASSDATIGASAHSSDGERAERVWAAIAHGK